MARKSSIIMSAQERKDARTALRDELKTNTTLLVEMRKEHKLLEKEYSMQLKDMVKALTAQERLVLGNKTRLAALDPPVP